jgi:hypothetical protein
MAQSYDASQSELQSGLVERPLTTAILPERPLVAESSPSVSHISNNLSVRYWEKRTLSRRPYDPERGSSQNRTDSG